MFWVKRLGLGIMVWMLTACGGSGSMTPESDPLEAKLIDAYVSGVQYRCQGVESLTDAGLFAYESGCGMITFSIGGVTVGSIDATAVPSDGKLYANELAGQERSETRHASVVKLLVLLQSLDSDGDPSNGITIDQETRDALASASLDLTDSAVTLADVQTLLASIGKSAVETETAIAHFEKVLRDNEGLDIDTINHAPTAAAQSITVNEESADNPITLTASDSDGDTLIYTVVTQPQHGTLSGEAPTLTYTPTADYFGADSFSFKVNDGSVDSATATVTITVNE